MTYSDKGKGKAPPYPVMDFDDLLGLGEQVKRLTDKNCVMFLWTTWPHMPKAMALIKEWGFTYRTLGFEWVKLTKNNKLHFGCGYYSRANPEPCLLAVKGRMPVAVKNELNLIAEGRAWGGVIVDYWGGHSVKPRSSYEKIERLYPQSMYPNRIELFASRRSFVHAIEFGYVPVGFEIDGKDIRDALAEIGGAK